MIAAKIVEAARSIPEAGDILSQTCLLAAGVDWLETHARACEGPVLEIGTRHGLTAALFALCGHDVVTVDVVESRHREPLWKSLGVREQIDSRVDGIVPVAKYPTAFVDAVHTYEGCARHWRDIRDHMAPGALLLFDDMDYHGGEGGRFWREMGAEQVGRFGRLVLP